MYMRLFIPRLNIDLSKFNLFLKWTVLSFIERILPSYASCIYELF